MKSIITAPDVSRINEKHMREYYIPNACGVIITANYKSDGIHLPAEDRRHFVAWSSCQRLQFLETYWRDLWRRLAPAAIENFRSSVTEVRSSTRAGC